MNSNTKAKNTNHKETVKKTKIGKMRVTCEDCNSDITKIVESRESLRLKLKGFCESCNKPKVVYVDDVQQIIATGKRFDYIVKENTPSTALPGVPAQPGTAPAQPGATPAQAPTPNPAALQKAIADAIAGLAKVSGSQALTAPTAEALKKAIDDHVKENAAKATATPAQPGTSPVQPGTTPARPATTPGQPVAPGATPVPTPPAR